MIWEYIGNERIQYESVSGWVEFTGAGYNEYYGTMSSLEGIFEMDCDDNDGGIIQVRDGKFGPVQINLKDYTDDGV